jgi:hypothetical protein
MKFTDWRALGDVKFLLIELYKEKYQLTTAPEIITDNNDFVIPKGVWW